MSEIILADSIRRREDDRLVRELTERIYPALMEQLCRDMDCSKAELFGMISTQLERNRRQKKGKSALIVGAITAGVGGVVALAFDWIKRAP